MLAEHADKNGANARPSPLRIRFATGFDVRTIDRALKRLEKAELIALTGRHRSGTAVWRLAMDRRRPASFWDDLVAEDDKMRQAESGARQTRRLKEKARLSGTQNAGHIEPDVSNVPAVRDAESRTPELSVPDAGTQTPGHRDADSRRPARNAPRTTQEPSGNHPQNHPASIPGGAPPPDPRRPPTPTGPGNEQTDSLTEPLTTAQDVNGESLPRTPAREAGPDLRLVPGAGQPTNAPRGIFPAPVPTPAALASRRTPAQEAIAAATARCAAAREAHRRTQGTA